MQGFTAAGTGKDLQASSQVLHIPRDQKARLQRGLVPRCIAPDQPVASMTVDVGFSRYFIEVRTNVMVGEARP